jgi:hypothetical protein
MQSSLVGALDVLVPLAMPQVLAKAGQLLPRDLYAPPFWLSQKTLETTGALQT